MEANGFGGLVGETDGPTFKPSAEAGDVGDCFYNFLVPTMASWFSTGDWFSSDELSSLGMRPETIFDDELQVDTPLVDGEMVVACFAGMAMGWAWSLFLANEAVVHQSAFDRGFQQDDIIRDRNPAPSVLPGRPALGIYVDNVHVFAGNLGQAGSRMAGIAARFRDLGIPFEVDGVERKLEMDSLGLRLDFKGRVAALPKPSKTWRLWLATQEMLRWRKLHGKLLQVWLGHITHHFALMKSCMSILSACYRFAARHSHHRSAIWPSVRREMRLCRDLLFLVELDMSSPTCPEVHIGDSADFGYSLMTTQATHFEVRRELQFREKWRFVMSREPESNCLHGQQSASWFRGLDGEETNEKGIVHDDDQDFHYVGHGFPSSAGLDTQYGRQLKKQLASAALDPQIQAKKDRLFGFDRAPAPTLIEGPGIPDVHSCWDSPGRWTLITAKRWEHPTEHINVKEARVCLMGLRRLVRTSRNLGSVAMTLTDNLVAAFSFEKGRSSSHRMNGLCRRACAYAVAGRIQWRLRHIPTSRNVSDESSRWFQPDKKSKAPVKEGAHYGHTPVSSFEAGLLSTGSELGKDKQPSAPAGQGGFFLEMFSGTARLSKAMSEAGLPCLEDIEVGKGPTFNMLRKTSQKAVLRLISLGLILYCHFGTPCTVFSRARHNIKNWRKARQKELEGVTLALFTARCVRALVRRGCFFSIENPVTSTLWHFEPIRSIFKLQNVIFVRWHMCEYGAGYKKGTGLLTNVSALSGLHRSCQGGHSHQQLRGTERVIENGKWVSRNRTRGAGAYPTELCNLWASLVQRFFKESDWTPPEAQKWDRCFFNYELEKAASTSGVQESNQPPTDGRSDQDPGITEGLQDGRIYLSKHPVVFGQHTKEQATKIYEKASDSHWPARNSFAGIGTAESSEGATEDYWSLYGGDWELQDLAGW